MTSNLDMHSSAAVKNGAKEEEKRQNFRRASKKLFWGAFIPIALGFIFSNGLFLFLSPIILWLSWMSFVFSASIPSSGKNILENCEVKTSLKAEDLFDNEQFPSFYGSSYNNALHPCHDDDQQVQTTS